MNCLKLQQGEELATDARYFWPEHTDPQSPEILFGMPFWMRAGLQWAAVFLRLSR